MKQILMPTKLDAMEAENPGKYYISPSEKLMNALETIFNGAAFKDIPLCEKRYKNQAYGNCGNMDDDYSYIVNTDFLNVKEMNGEIKDGVTVFTFPTSKLKKIRRMWLEFRLSSISTSSSERNRRWVLWFL
ncbi:hypothetical protein MKX01_019627 [Papaver californicum]|nr:hypothetical protein MKX01_019627 [Papaver californicum]